MSFNGSGTFLINTAGQPVVAGTVISSTAFNALTADLATGLSTVITKDGQTTVTANIPMSTYKFTGLGVGSAATDSANLSQVQSTVTKLLTSVSGTDTITAVGAPVVAAYAAGQMFYFVATGDNTGAVTLNIDSLGAKAVTRDGSVALAAGDIKSGEVVVVVYDGTRFQVVSQLNSAGDARFANVSIASSLYVGGVSTFVGNAGFSANVSIASALSVGGVAAITGATTIGGNLTLNGGTANGVLYLNGSKVATSGSALTFDGTNLQVGATPGAEIRFPRFSDNSAVLTIKSNTSVNELQLLNNSGGGSNYLRLGNGYLSFGAEASEGMRLPSTGLGIGTSSPANKLHVVGTSATPSIRIGSSSVLSAYWDIGRENATSGDFLFMNGSTQVMCLTNSGGNLGLGVTPSAWSSSFGIKAFDISGGAVYGSSSDVNMVWNGVYNTSNQWAYKASATANLYTQDGAHKWYNAASGTAGNAISFTQAMTLSSTADRGTLNINGNTQALFELSHAGTRKSYLYQIGTELQIFNEVSGIMAFGTNGTERARITSGGNLLVGTTSDNGYHRFVKSNTSDWTCTFTNSSATTPWGISVGYSAAAPNNTNSGISLSDTGGERATIRNNGGLANYSANNVNLSDERTKKNIVPLGSMWDKFKAIEIVKFKYRDQTHDDDNIGVIAQQVESVAPEFVDIDGFGETPEDGVPFKTVYTTDMYHAAIKALQEAMARIEQLEAKFAALETK
jgi:hypothetical protein